MGLKITELSALTTPANADILAIVDDVVGTPTTKKITVANLHGALVSAAANLTANALVVGNDGAKGIKVQPGTFCPDYNEANQGLTGNSKSAKAYIDAIGSDSATLVFRHSSGAATTTYTFSTDETIPSNINVVIEKGAILSIATVITLTINGSFEAGLYQVFSGAGSIIFGEGVTKEVSPEWWFSSGDYGLAVSSAIASIADVGGKIIFTKSRDCTTPINATGIRKGLVFEGRGVSDAANSYAVTLAFAHTGVGFDCSNSESFIFRDLKVKGGPLAQNPVTTIPTVGILFARPAAGSGCGKHFLENVIFDYTSKFSIAGIYSYGSEENIYLNVRVMNNQADAKCVYITGSNVAGVTSSFITLATGAMSNVCHKFIGGAYVQRGETTSGDVFYLEGLGDFRVDGAFLLNDAGRSMFYFDSDNASCANITIENTRDEGGVTGVLYEIYAKAGANVASTWTIQNNHWGAVTNSMYLGDGLNGYNITYSGNSDGTAAGVSVKGLRFSHIDMNTAFFVGRAGGIIISCDISGNVFASFTLNGTMRQTNLRDYQYNTEIHSMSAVSNNPYGTLTLTANATSTTITDPSTIITANSIILLFPVTATAAVAVGSATGVYISAKTAGTSFVITHPNTADADKTFSYMIVN